MDSIQKQAPRAYVDHRSTIGDTFDEEIGSRVAINNTNDRGAPARRNKNLLYFIGGSAALIVIIALAVGLGARSGDTAEAAAPATGSSVPEIDASPVEVPTMLSGDPAAEPTNNNDLGGIVTFVPDESASVSSDEPEPAAETVEEPVVAETSEEPSYEEPADEAQASEPVAPSGGFEPEQQVGDAALINLPEVVALAESTPSPTDAPTPEPTPSPTPNPVEDPTEAPTSEPTNPPTAPPTEDPTNDPTPSPTPEPTPEPTPAPTNEPTDKPIDISAWASMNWNPTNKPTMAPTPNPTPLPTPPPTTAKPTINLSGWSNMNWSGTPEPTPAPTPPPTPAPTPSPTQSTFFGEELVTWEEYGIEASTGLEFRVIARTGQKVQYANGDSSGLSYHAKSDAAGIILEDPSNPLGAGYAYVTNSERNDNEGGVYSIHFDKEGNVLQYKELLSKTSRNCGGGHTPWNTWISCEEQEDLDGQCWQIDPYAERAEKTVLGDDNGGGEYESVACDNRNPANPVFFTTEDLSDGALRRFVAQGAGWDVLHSDGDHSFLEFTGDGTFQWTTDEDAARDSASKWYPNTEGIQFHEGKLYFMAKERMEMFILDVDNFTWEKEDSGKKFYGEGSFEEQPDQNMFGPTRKFMYFTEDGGKSPGVYARYGRDGTYFTLFQGIPGGEYADDETIGIALSPDHRRLYAGIQDAGIIFEITRSDGLPFE